MKKLLAALAIMFTLASSAWAVGVVGSTGDALIAVGRGSFRGIIVHTDATNSVTVDIYDATSATGTKLLSSWTVTTSAVDRVQAIGFSDNECPFENGIYVDVTTSGTVTYDTYYVSR